MTDKRVSGATADVPRVMEIVKKFGLEILPASGVGNTEELTSARNNFKQS